MFYIIAASVTEVTPDGWTSTRELPTFILSADIQGIVDEDHARRIALDLLRTANPRGDFAVGVCPLGDMAVVPF